jgi:lysine decarboxylase
VLVARNSHKSLIASCIIGHVRPVFLNPDVDTDWDIHHGITPDELERALAEQPDAKGVFVVSPTYYGVTSDVEALADICHRRRIPLVVDEAWGPHFPFHPEMPRSAIHCGADISVGSIHKTMAGLEQASIILMSSRLIGVDRLELCYDLFESTSPSVPILAAIDATRRQFVKDGKQLIGNMLRLARHARQELARIDGIRVMGCEVVDGVGRLALDETKVLFDVSGLGVTGYEAEDWLTEERQLTLGLSDERHLLVTFMVGSDDDSTKELIEGVREMAKWARSRGRHNGRPSMPRRRELGAKQVMPPSEAFFARCEVIPLDRAAGRVAAEMVSPYPPGIPNVLPGERITETQIAYLRESLDAGAFIMDARMTNDGVVRVVAD